MNRLHLFRVQAPALLAAAALVLGLAGCMPHPVLTPGTPASDFAWSEFRRLFVPAKAPAPAILVRGSFTYTAPEPHKKTNRTVMLFFGDLGGVLRLDVQAGIGTPLAFIREADEGLLAFYPERKAAYRHWDPVVGAQRLGLPFPFSLRDLAALLAGDFGHLVPVAYDGVRTLDGTGFEYTFTKGRVTRLVLDEWGRPQSLTGPLHRPPREDGTPRGPETWQITFDHYQDLPSPLCNSLTLDLPHGEQGVLRIKSRELKLQAWPAASLELKLPEGVAIRRLDREEAPNVLEMGGGNGQNGQNGQPAPAAPAEARP